MTMAPPVLSVVVLNLNTRELVLACLRALAAERRGMRASDRGRHGSTTARRTRSRPRSRRVRLLRNAENNSTGLATTRASPPRRAEYVCTLN